MIEIKEYSVSEISSKIRGIIESEIDSIKVKGEVSNFKLASSGHAYFNLKDDKSVLNCTCWKTVMNRVRFDLIDGLEVTVTGKITTYSGQSRYQLCAEQILESGTGALIQMLQQRKEKLAAEGLFDLARKKPLPKFPQKIGVITSITGAVIKDILHRIKDRYPLEVLIWPVTVQGEACAKEVSAAIYGFNSTSISLKPDVIIIARGGGSIEDLWGFNEEAVVRAIAKSSIPVISAIGHEVDFTLADLVADVRSPTPTAAAEMAVPVLSDIKNYIRHQAGLLNTVTLTRFRSLSSLLGYYANFIKFPMTLFNLYFQTLDDLSFRWKESIEQYLKQKMYNLNTYQLNFVNLINCLELKKAHLNEVNTKLTISMSKILDQKVNKLHLLDSLIINMSHNKVLNRGFAIVRSSEGVVISSLTQVMCGQFLEIELNDGKLKVKII